MTKRQIVIKKGFDITYDLDGSIDNCIAYLNILKNKGYTDLSVEYDEGSRSLVPEERRLENDTEYQARLEETRNAAAKCIEIKKKQFEQLKKELGL